MLGVKKVANVIPPPFVGQHVIAITNAWSSALLILIPYSQHTVTLRITSGGRMVVVDDFQR